MQRSKISHIILRVGDDAARRGLAAEEGLR